MATTASATAAPEATASAPLTPEASVAHRDDSLIAFWVGGDEYLPYPMRAEYRWTHHHDWPDVQQFYRQ